MSLDRILKGLYLSFFWCKPSNLCCGRFSEMLVDKSIQGYFTEHKNANKRSKHIFQL
eukprot:UN22930